MTQVIKKNRSKLNPQLRRPIGKNPRQCSFMMGEEFHEKLRLLALKMRCTQTDVIRILIDEAKFPDE